MTSSQKEAPHYRTGLALLAAATLAGCVAAPRPHPARASSVDYQPAPTEIVVYPAQGQSSQRLDRDRYECHLWAVRESGYDPSASPASSYRTAAPRVEPDPPAGYSTTMGAVSGAVIGAAVANPRRTAEGAAIGAVVGAVAGSAADNARQARADAVENAYARRNERQAERNDRGYRRAMIACLQGRGYTVR